MKTRILIVLLITAGCFACAKATDKKYEPTEVQKLELKVMHRDVEIAQIGFQEAQNNLTTKLNLMTAKAEEIKKQNKWPADLIFKPDPMTFEPPPKPAPAPVPTKK